MDLIVHSPLVAGGIRVDFTVSSALSADALARGSALRDGAAAAQAEAGKERRYDNCRVHAFAVEDHGRIGDSARDFIRMVAPTDPSARTKAISRLYQGLAATLQRVAADAVISATTQCAVVPRR